MAISRTDLAHYQRYVDAEQSIAVLDPVALKAARAHSGSVQDRLLSYAAAHSKAGEARKALNTLYRRVRLGHWAIYAIAALIGAGAAVTAFVDAAPGGAAKVNVFWLFAALLGPHLVSLLIWLILLWRRPKEGEGLSLAGLLFAGLRRLGASTGPLQVAGQVLAERMLSGASGRWHMARLSHGAWLAFLTSATIAAALTMSFQRYDFMWETTLLSDPQVLQLFDLARQPLNALGAPVPSLIDIAAAKNGVGRDAPQNAQLWGQFVLGVVVLFGVLPRLLLWALSRFMLGRAARRAQLSASDPYFAAVLALIYQPDASVDVVDADDGGSRLDTASPPKSAVTPVPEMTSVVGWELDQSVLDSMQVTALGSYDRVGDLVEALNTNAPDEGRALAVSLLSTPDRGVEAAVRAALEACEGGLVVILCQRSALSARLSDADRQRRMADWWAMLSRAGVSPDHIHVAESS